MTDSGKLYKLTYSMCIDMEDYYHVLSSSLLAIRRYFYGSRSFLLTDGQSKEKEKIGIDKKTREKRKIPTTEDSVATSGGQ